MFIHPLVLFALLEQYNTMKPIKAEHNPPSKALLTGIVDLMVNASETLIEKSKYAGSEQYHGINVVPRAVNIRHIRFAPIANAVIPITPVNNDKPTILPQTFRSFFLYSSLYLKIKERKNPSNKPIVKNADVLFTQSKYRVVASVFSL